MLAQMNTSNGISLHFSSTLFLPPPQPPLPQVFTTRKPLSNYRFLLELRPVFCRSRRWDSNAESLRNFNFEYNDDDDDNDEELEQWTEVVEDYIDSIWIIKVFRSFGWLLPFVILSLLLATDSKAFLMALALPIGQSTLSFVFQRLWDRGKNKRKRRTKIKKRSRPRTSRTVKLNKEWGESQEETKKKTGYQPWIPRNDVSNKSSDEDAYSFGGWDELDRGEDLKESSRRRGDRTATRSQGMFTEKGKSSQSEMPLLLRLLIAVFPFLGSFTKML
ncbi:uncharacterized protein LOC111393634 [Olea europaea var. sylvestris]|uniref:uncharacterized protein LOC111393634 n=1 Tax=Olea europaea var. sylvestris TaxID=158386 RepID=UPI000C1CFA02|nr:uncharacterized protein LOC111393634 [Olea europaea var. sylvestris]